jgi:hypothetical protein
MTTTLQDPRFAEQFEAKNLAFNYILLKVPAFAERTFSHLQLTFVPSQRAQSPKHVTRNRSKLYRIDVRGYRSHGNVVPDLVQCLPRQPSSITTWVFRRSPLHSSTLPELVDTSLSRSAPVGKFALRSRVCTPRGTRVFPSTRDLIL